MTHVGALPMTESAPKLDRNAMRRVVLAHARDIRIKARIIKLRQLAEQTARGALPAPYDDLPRHGD